VTRKVGIDEKIKRNKGRHNGGFVGNDDNDRRWNGGVAAADTTTGQGTAVSVKNVKTDGAALKLTDQWDKVFPQSKKVNHRKVTFHNRYGITLAADLYEPKNVTGKLPAIAVSGPFGAVKEQSSGLYAQTMAERGYLTIAFDPSFTGESGGQPRDVASPDINTEDFFGSCRLLVYGCSC
jgi:predicted acyl esterase